jgi:hypothetical protein
MTERRTPSEWFAAGVTDRRILDPDGWRGVNAPTWDTPITRDEFERRLAMCTTTGPAAARPNTDPNAPTSAPALVAGEQPAAAVGTPAPGTNPLPGAVRAPAAATGETGPAAGAQQPAQWTVREPRGAQRDHVFESRDAATAAAADCASLYPGQPVVVTCPTGVRVAYTAVWLPDGLPDRLVASTIAETVRCVRGLA